MQRTEGQVPPIDEAIVYGEWMLRMADSEQDERPAGLREFVQHLGLLDSSMSERLRPYVIYSQAIAGLRCGDASYKPTVGNLEWFCAWYKRHGCAIPKCLRNMLDGRQPDDDGPLPGVPMTDKALKRGQALLLVKSSETPREAKDFTAHCCSQAGGIHLQVILFAYTVYAQVVEGLRCEDNTYKASPEQLDWFAEWYDSRGFDRPKSLINMLAGRHPDQDEEDPRQSIGRERPDEYVYHVWVLQDETSDTAGPGLPYTIITKQPVPKEWLQVAAMVMDGGVRAEVLDQETPTAASYVSVKTNVEETIREYLHRVVPREFIHCFHQGHHESQDWLDWLVWTPVGQSVMELVEQALKLHRLWSGPNPLRAEQYWNDVAVSCRVFAYG